MEDAKRLFCAKPFTWFEVSRGREEGEVFLCCPGWLKRPVGNLLRQSVAETWNGPAAQDIRRSILDGSFEYCDASLCPHIQEISGPVQRIEDVTDPVLRDVIRERLTVLPYGPREVNCAHDRSCNLSCPSCRTELIIETARRDEILGIQKKLDHEALADAETLYITGSGDPFGSPFFRKWLQTMRRTDMPRLRTLHLHTNGLLWTPRVWETIPPEIRALIRTAEISIDAASPETYAVNRRGGSFGTLLDRLEFIQSLRRAGPLERLTMSMVVQQNNFHEMREFVLLGKRFAADAVYFSRLADWGTFDQAELSNRSVHRTDHPRHREFLDVLSDGLFDDPIVVLGNLTEVRRGGPARGTGTEVEHDATRVVTVVGRALRRAANRLWPLR